MRITLYTVEVPSAELLLFGVERLFLQNTRLHRGLISSARLLHGDDGVLNVHANLILLLAQGKFALADG